MIKFDRDGLVPAILQDADTGRVLMVAYMNAEALRLTQETGDAWFWSRSRQEMWHKGSTSGNYQRVVDLTADCDGDAVLVKVHPDGPACHTGAVSCFFEPVQIGDSEHGSEAEWRSETSSPTSVGPEIVTELAALLAERRATLPDGSYTAKLFREGIDSIAKKVGEESAETIIAAKNGAHDEIVWEVADLWFHTLVLLEASAVPVSDVWQELARRRR
jgi:phosphoribosyl-ATP pyrophosphohydrolase/phosphoribosyl-AMP cyclohydrolase